MKIQDIGLFVVWYNYSTGSTIYHKFSPDELTEAIKQYEQVKAEAAENPDAVGFGVHVVPSREKPLEFGEDAHEIEIGEGIYGYCYHEEEKPVKPEVKHQAESDQMSLF